MPEPLAPQPTARVDARRPVEIDDDQELPVEAPARAERPAPARAAPRPAPSPPVQFPVPPTAAETPPGSPAASEVAAPAVPTWAVRTRPRPTPSAPQFVGDIAIDPDSLRPKLTVRAGLSALTVNGRELVLRSRMHRERMPWSMVQGFEPRFPDGEVSTTTYGQLVALTPAGPIGLPGTRRQAGELRHVHALLDAYRVRAQRLANA